jgi:hypothetical protein
MNGPAVRGSLHESALSVRRLKTLANSGSQQRLPLPQRSERTGRQLISSAPNLISSQTDVFPAERRYMQQQVLVDRHALAPQLRVGHLQVLRVPMDVRCQGRKRPAQPIFETRRIDSRRYGAI